MLEVTLIKELKEFLERNYVFIHLELDEWLYSEKTIRYLKKESDLGLDYDIVYGADKLMEGVFDDWEILIGKEVDYLFDQFNYYMFMVFNVKTGIKSRKNLIKKEMLFLISEHLSKQVKFDKRLMPFFQLKRERSKRVRPLEMHQRKPVELNLWEKCYVFRYNSGALIVDPAIVFNINEGVYKLYDIMYFSNFGNYKNTTNKLEINGYGFMKLEPTQIGRTPEEAVRNKAD